MEWRKPTPSTATADAISPVCRHHELSDDVGYRFSNKTWVGYPLRAETYAAHLQGVGRLCSSAGTTRLSGNHNLDTGIFEFMRACQPLKKQGAVLPSEALEQFGQTRAIYPCRSWHHLERAREDGFFLGNPPQAVFRLMHSVRCPLDRITHLLGLISVLSPQPT